MMAWPPPSVTSSASSRDFRPCQSMSGAIATWLEQAQSRLGTGRLGGD